MEKVIKTFFDNYKEIAKNKKDKVLLRIDDRELTYTRFMEETSIISSGMKKLGIAENDKVGIIMPNSIEWYLVFWSAIRIGAQPVPIDPQSGVLELTRLIPATTVKICFAASKYRNNNIIDVLHEVVPSKTSLDKIICFTDNKESFTEDNIFVDYDKYVTNYCSKNEEIYEPDENHVMSLACTSGSTGTPKILSVPYYGFFKAADDMGKYLEFNEDDVMMLGMTLYHQGGFGMGLQNTLKGGTVMYQPQFNPLTFLETVQKYKVTVIQLTSTLAKVLLSTPDFDSYDISSVKVCYFAGEVLPKELADRFVNDLHIRVINVIGSSETATMVVWDSMNDGELDPSDFKKLPFTDVKVIGENNTDAQIGEVGELCIQTDAVIFDYFGNKELSEDKIKTDAQGKRWFLTGDLVEKLNDNRVRFAGRSKRIIKRGGNLVHAEEVEACLLTHPNISAAAVTAQDHSVIGQQIIAYVQVANTDKLTRGDIAKYFDGKLSAYKIPDKVIVVDEIPKDVGKIQYKYLRN